MRWKWTAMLGVALAGCGPEALRDSRSGPVVEAPGDAPDPAVPQRPEPTRPDTPEAPVVETCATACLAGCTYADPPTAPLWTYAPPVATTWLDWRGFSDAEGNLYWREESAAGCEIVSMAIDGTLRYRVAAPCVPVDHDIGLVLQSGLFVSFRESTLTAQDARTGATVWTHVEAQPAACRVDVEAFAASAETVYAVIRSMCGQYPDWQMSWTWLVLDLATGAVRNRGEPVRGSWTVVNPTLVVDAAGNAYVRYGMDPPGSGPHDDELFSLDRDGNVRWHVRESVPIDPEAEYEDDYFVPIGIARDRLFVRTTPGSMQIRDAATGGLLHDLPFEPGYMNPLQDVAAGVVLSPDGERVYLAHGSQQFSALDGGATTWSRLLQDDLGLAAYEPNHLLTGSGAVLLWSIGPGNEPRMVALAADGSIERACGLASEGGFTAVFHGDTFVTSTNGGLSAFRVPGLGGEAPTGWTSPAGGPSRSHTAR